MRKVHVLALQRAQKCILDGKAKHQEAAIAAANKSNPNAATDSCRIAVEGNALIDEAVDWIKSVIYDS